MCSDEFFLEHVYIHVGLIVHAMIGY